MTETLTAIPQPSEIVAFLIRAMSHVDNQDKHALKKELQRLRKGKPVSPEAANNLLKEHLADFHTANGNDNWGATDFLDALRGYTALCLQLDCAALPTDAVRGVFDRLAFGCFQEILRNVLPVTGVSPNEILGKPKQATRLLWQSRVKDFGLSRLATEIESNLSSHKAEGTWKTKIKRWSKGEHDPQINTILALMKNWDPKFARALLAARIYQQYCELSLVDPREHVAGYELSFDLNAIQSAIADIMGSAKYSKICGLSKDQEQSINEVAKLTTPHLPKAQGDSSKTQALFEALEASLQGQPRLAGLQFYRGRYYAQLGQFSDALNAFEEAAEWFQFRSAVQMKSCLHYILNIAQKLGKQRSFAKWHGWCDGLGLEIDIRDADLSVAKDFPHPFPEVEATDPLSKYLLILPAWEERKPDLRNPNRVIKGYGHTPSPQLALFANLGQVEKVQQLLSVGADPNILDKNNGSALLNALQGGDEACIHALLSVTSKETINTRTIGGKSPLLVAVGLGRADYVQSLIEKGAGVEMMLAEQQTALFEVIGHFAAPEVFSNAALQYGGRSTDMLAFLRKTSSPFRDDEARAQAMSRYSPEELLILPELTKYFVKGDSPDMRNIVQLLLDAGADVNASCGSAKLTPFLYATEIGNSWLIKTLIDHGADMRSQDERGGTAFSRLHYFGHSALATELLAWVSPQDRIWLKETAFR
jgi:tetratricopeptide (TPR) repeat protein